MSFILNNGVWETVKAPWAELGYSIDWGPVHSDEGSIVSSDWIVDPGDGTPPTINPLDTEITGFVTTALVRGGSLGNTYTIRNRVVLQTGLRDERIFRMKIREVSG